MRLTRRGLFRMLAGAIAAAVTPGRAIFEPKFYSCTVTLAEVDVIAKRTILPGIIDDFFKPSPLAAYLGKGK